MGQSSGKESVASDELYGFNREEFKILETKLKPLVTNHHGDMTKLKKMLESSGLSPCLSERICRVLNEQSSQQSIHKTKRLQSTSWSGILRLLSKILRGNSEGLSEVIVKLSNGNNIDNTVTAEQLFKFLSEICCCYYKMIGGSQPAISWQLKNYSHELLDSDINRLVFNQMHPLIHKGKDLKDVIRLPSVSLSQILLTKEDLETWLTRTPTMLNIIERVFDTAFHLVTPNDVQCEDAENYSELLPMCEGLNKCKTMLGVSEVLILNQSLPSRLRSKWKLLFSSTSHGESFSQMLGRVQDQGPTLLIVRDSEGYMFGGFATESWTLKPQFAGSSECFLFCLRPNIGVFNTTGYNDHYMYLNLHQQTMPNGLGMGGQLEYFGFWLDSEYGLGKCAKSCTTYQSPLLSSTEQFNFADMEVWRIGIPPKTEDDEDQPKLRPKKSILDKIDPGLKNVLEMAGREMKSEALREEDAKMKDDEDQPKLRPKKSILDKIDPGLKNVLEMTGREMKSEALREEDAKMETARRQ